MREREDEEEEEEEQGRRERGVCLKDEETLYTMKMIIAEYHIYTNVQCEEVN